MEQIKIVMLLVGILCFVVLAGSQKSKTESRGSKLNSDIIGQGQSGVTAPDVATSTSRRSPTGRPTSTTVRRSSTSRHREIREASNSLFYCVDGSGSINSTLLCNGRIDCPDSSDENSQLCNGTACMNTFPCRNGECVGLDAVCNGSYECGDHSDEVSYPYCLFTAATVTHTCANGQVLVGNNITCNGVYNCMDKSDEFNCSKCLGQPGQLMCDGGYRCVKPEAICNRIQDCFDGADESCLIPNNTRCNVGQFICPTGLCVSTDQIMSGSRCWGSQGPTLEDNLKYCMLPNLLCDGDNKCIQSEYRCDGKADCLDGTDEMSPHNISMSDPSFKCSNGYCVPYLETCNYLNDCGDYSDEFPFSLQCSLFTAVNCSTVGIHSLYWQCDNGLCIHSYRVNDGSNNCGDNSDEKNISSLFFTCSNQKKVLLSFLCDGRDNCGDNSDETYSSCVVNTPRPTCPQHTCPSGKCIRYTDVCDSYNDCGDRSDELGCPTHRSICLSHSCPSGKCIPSSYVCDGSDDCGDDSDESYCPGTYTHTKVAVGVCVPGGVVVFIGGCFGARRRRQATARTTRAQAVNRAVITTTTITATAASNQHPSFAPLPPSYAQLPPSYSQVVGSSVADQGVTNQGFVPSDAVSK